MNQNNKSPRKTIGFINPSLHLPWEDIQLKGILDGARELDVNISILPGGRLNSSIPGEAQRNILYKLADNRNLDGLIIWSSGLDEFVSHKTLAEFIHSFSPLPVISLEHSVSGIPSIRMDSYTTLKSLIRHLIDDHGYRSIAYIRGAENHTAEMERYKAYLDAMEESGLSIQPEWIVPPIVIQEEEPEIQRLSRWFSQFGKKLEAVVAFNDIRIIYFIKAMKRLGVKIPEDLAVCGYDNIPQDIFSHPFLSTIGAPFYEMGYHSVELIVQMIDGKSIPEETAFKGQPIYRESCGCSVGDGGGTSLSDSSEALIRLGRKTRYQQLISRMRSELIAAPDPDINRKVFLKVFSEGLARLEIPSCRILLYETPFKSLDKIDLNVILQPYMDYQESNSNLFPQRNIPIGKLKNMLNTDQGKRYSLIVLPIFFNQTHFGLALLEMGPLDGDLYQSLMLLLGAFFEEFRLLNNLSESIIELNKTRDLLVQSEKIAALSNLTGGVAHQINTPLGISLTAASYLENCCEELMNNDDDPSERILSELVSVLKKGLPLILTNLEKVADLVSNFKNISIDQTIGEKRTILMNMFFEEQLISLKYRWKDLITVKLTCPENIGINSYPGAFSQILVQLVENSVIHGSPDSPSVSICLDVQYIGETLIITYEDNGPGISPDLIKKIYDPFFSTRGGNKSPGMGLFIVYNLVTQKLMGTIECTNKQEDGIRFVIKVPS